MNSSLVWSTEDPFSLRPITFCSRNPSFDGSSEPGLAQRRSEVNDRTARTQLHSDASLRARLALLLSRLDVKRQAVCERWATLACQGIPNYRGNDMELLECRSRHKTVASRRVQCSQIRTSLTQELESTDQGCTLLDTQPQLERNSLHFNQQKAQILTAQWEMREQERQKTEELAEDCRQLRKQLAIKRERVGRKRMTVIRTQELREERKSQRTRQNCRKQAPVLCEKTQKLHDCSEEVSHALARAETEIEAHARNIEELMQRIDLVESSLQKRRYA